MKKNKKTIGIVIIVIVVIVLLGVLYFVDKQNTKTMEADIKTPALDYFDNYMSANTGSTAYKVTLKMLKEANEDGEDYNLSSLSKCDENKTYATINIDYSTGKVSDTTVNLKCKKF